MQGAQGHWLLAHRSVALSLLLPMALLLLCSSDVRNAHGLVISNSRLEVCEDRGDEPRSFRTGGACKKKLIMTLSIGNDQVIPEVVEVNRYTEDGVQKPLGQRFRIFPSKSPVHVMYPLVYRASVNSKPWEKWFKVKRTGLEVFLNSRVCKDAPGHKKPTCGWFEDQGERVPDSQGFCCTCDDSDVFGGSSLNANRGNLRCVLWAQHRSTAHCLRFHNNWYDVWELERPYVVHTIRLVIYRESSYNGTVPEANQACRRVNAQPIRNQGTVFYCYDILNIGVQQKVARSDNGTVIATYVGDLLPSIMPYDLTQKYLMAPNYYQFPNASDPMHFFLNKPAFWMIFDKYQIDITGITCDKPGIYFTGFRLHGISGGCSRSPNSCLQNQPFDIISRELFNFRAGEQPQHLVQRYGQPKLRSGSERRYVLSFEQEQVQDSIYTLEIDADDSRIFVLDLHFDIMETAVFGLASVSRDIFLWVEVARADFRPGTVYVSVFCSEDVLPVPTSAYSWGFEGDGHLGDIIIPLRTTSTKALIHKCRVEARNARGRLTETAEVAFQTTATCACLGLCECTCVDDQPVACWDDDEPLGNDFELDQEDDDDWLGLDGLGDRLKKLFDLLGLDFNDLLGILAGLLGLGALAACIKLGLLPAILSCLVRRLCSCFGCGCGGDDDDDSNDDSGNKSSKTTRPRSKNNNNSSKKSERRRRNNKVRGGRESDSSSDEGTKSESKSKRDKRFGEATASGKRGPGGGKLPRRQQSRTSVRKHRVGTDSDAWMNGAMKRHNNPFARLSRFTSALSFASRTSRHAQRDSDDDDNGYMTVGNVSSTTSMCSVADLRKRTLGEQREPNGDAGATPSLEELEGQRQGLGKEGQHQPQEQQQAQQPKQCVGDARPLAGDSVPNNQTHSTDTSHSAQEATISVGADAEVSDELFRLEHIQFDDKEGGPVKKKQDA